MAPGFQYRKSPDGQVSANGTANHNPDTTDPFAQNPAVTVALVCACLVFFVLLIYPTARGRIYAAWDLIYFHFPVRKFYSDCLGSHDSFLWFPNIFGGYYIFGEGQAGMLHPFHLLIYRMLPLVVAFGVEFVSSYAFLLLGTFLLLRRWRLSVASSLFGGFIFTFGGTNLSRYLHINATAVVAHLPWILLVMDHCFAAREFKTRSIWASVFASLLASQILIGHPQEFLLTAIISGWYAAYLLTVSVGRDKWIAMTFLAGAGLLALFLGAVQLLPTLAVTQASARAHPTIEYRGYMSLHPEELIQFLNPLVWQSGHFDQEHSRHELFVYSGGTVILLLFVWGCLQSKIEQEKRTLWKFCAVLMISGLFLALGRFNGLFPYYAWFPLLGLFRVPARYILLSHFALSVGAAMAIEQIRGSSRTLERALSARILAVSLAMLALVSVVLAVRAHSGPTEGLMRNLPNIGKWAGHFASPGQVAAGAGFVLVGAGLFLAAFHSVWIARGGLVLFVVLEILAIQGLILYRQETVDPFSFASSGRNRPPIPPPGPIQGRVWENLPTLLGYRLVNGYSALEPVTNPPMDTRSYAYLMGARSFWDGEWKPMPAALPLVRLRSDVVVTRDPEKVIPVVDLAKTALVESSLLLDAGAAGQLRVLEERPGRVRLSTEASGRLLATIGTRFDRGWNMEMDGSPAEILHVDGNLLGFVVLPGHHQIGLKFEPKDFEQGNLLSFIGLAFISLYAVFVYISTRYSFGIFRRPRSNTAL